jgi:hypothetical protein
MGNRRLKQLRRIENPMTTSATAIERLNAAQYVFLRSLSEPRDNSLTLVVEEAVVSRSGSVPLDLSALANVLKKASSIESIGRCRTFELHWKHYAAYLVTEELVGSNAGRGYEDECYTGKILRVYSKSHFLDHIDRDTGGHVEPLQHHKIVCLNHLIDVAAYAPPEVQLLGIEGNV